MNIRLVTTLFIVIFSVSVFAQDGKIVDQKVFTFSDELKKEIYASHGDKTPKEKYSYLKDVELFAITYLSDGLNVKGYLAQPGAKQKHPCIIYNRGGNREFGSLNEFKMLHILAPLAANGFVVVASNYRGNGGGEGIEEFGGAEVADILNLIPLLEALPNADAGKIGMYGWSRGGMMTYITLTKTNRIKAAVIGAGLSDSFMMIKRRPEMESVYSELVPGYSKNKQHSLEARSAVLWADKLCKTTPILLLHGTADWRVVPEQALEMSAALLKAKRPFRLILFEGGDHGLTEHREKVNRETIEWFTRYLYHDAPLPNLEPHGR